MGAPGPASPGPVFPAPAPAKLAPDGLARGPAAAGAVASGEAQLAAEVVTVKPVSTKELNYVRDHLSWELLATKTCHDAAKNTSEQEFKRLFDEAGNVHQRNYEKLLGYLETAQKG